MKKIYIDGMSCEHCTAHIREALEALDGVGRVLEVSLSGKYALIEGSASDDALTAAIEEEGYDVIRIE